MHSASLRPAAESGRSRSSAAGSALACRIMIRCFIAPFMDPREGSFIIAWLEGGASVSRHPLVARSRDPRVRQARGFREAAAELTGEILAAEFEVEREGA